MERISRVRVTIRRLPVKKESLLIEFGTAPAPNTIAPRRFRSDLYYAIEKTLRENHIEIPFPQRDVRLRRDPGMLEA